MYKHVDFLPFIKRDNRLLIICRWFLPGRQEVIAVPSYYFKKTKPKEAQTLFDDYKPFIMIKL